MPSTTAVASLSGKSTAGDLGATVDFTTAKTIVTAVIMPTLPVTDGMVVVQASQDGLNWVDIAAVEVRGGINRSFDNNGGAYRYWRTNVLARINGGSVSSTFMEAG